MIFETFKRLTGAAVLAVGISGAAQASTVDTVLSLVIDISGSISASEYNLMMDGYANAFRDSTIQAGILDTGNGDVGKIAVNVVQFGTTAGQVVGFTILDTIDAINGFANTLDTLARNFSLGGSTCIACGLSVSKSLLDGWLGVDSNSAARAVIDVSGDGNDNVSGGTIAARELAVRDARDAACGAGYTVNGITVGAESILDYYKDNVICPSGAFALRAIGFSSFESAVKTKLAAEITGQPIDPIPLPAGAWLLLGGLGAFAAVRRKKAA